MALRKWTWILAGALVLLLAASPVLAAGGGRLRDRDGSGLDQLRLQLRDATCAELGVTPEQFQQARQRAATAMVDQLQAQGRITTEQAECIRQRIEQGDFGLVMGRAAAGVRKGLGVGRAGIQLQAGRLALAELAEFLGMTGEDFWGALRSGRSVAEVAEEKGRTRQEVIDFLTAQVKARLDEAVASGKITQERADEVMAAFESRLPQLLDGVRDCPNGPCGVPGPGGGRGGRGPRAPQTPAAPQSSGP